MSLLRKIMFGVFVVALLMGLAGAAPALAQSPWWNTTSVVSPTVLSQGGEGTIVVRALNLGDESASGTITVTDTLPAGVTVRHVPGEPGEPDEPNVTMVKFEGPRESPPEECGELSPGKVQCTYSNLYPPINPYEYLEMTIGVKVTGSSGGQNRVEVSGGGAPDVQIERPVTVSGGSTPFGVEDFAIVPEEEGGKVDWRAGSHPFQLTTTFNLNETVDPFRPPALPKDLHFMLPVGLVGNPTAVAQCSGRDFTTKHFDGLGNQCAGDTAIGVATITFDEPGLGGGVQTHPVPLFNLTPNRGEPARFGFEYANTPVILDVSVRSGSDYGVTVDVDNITQLANFMESTVTFWGVPNASVHDQSRGWECLSGGTYAHEVGESQIPCNRSNVSRPQAFLTLPTSCAAPFVPRVQIDSWPVRNGSGSEPVSIYPPVSEYSLQDQFGRVLGLTGCNQLPFEPSIEVAPDVQEGSSSSGLKVNVHVPQEVSENGGGLAGSNVKTIAVALPEGVALNPAGSDGLEACSQGLVGFTGFSEYSGGNTATFTSALPEPLQQGVDFCPDASKIGTVSIKSPLLPNPVVGAVYLAEQNENPFGSLVAMYIVAEDPASGFLVKLPGMVHLTETGQIVTTFENNPQLPFEDAELHFFGGERAPLSTPSRCGPYTTQASFAPWSGNPSVNSTSTFDITSGPDGSPCPGAALPFDPSLTAGTTSIQAGGFSPFTMTMSREDGNQLLQAINLHMPAGLSGLLSGIQLCPEPLADQGLCGPGSQIGETIVSVGVGGNPFSVRGGRVYITGPYDGAPYGLSIVNPAKAGPFDLEKGTPCDCVVVRAKIEVDPITAALTITSDNTGPYKIPTILDGIPLQIRHVNVTINRPGFTFNPTNCDPLQIKGSLTSTEGAAASLSVPLQVTNCAVLGFKPAFSVSTAGKTSRSNGASLHVKLTYPKAPFGSQANIRSVKVDLPRQLPSRLSTLQKACPVATFEANPANCSSGSRVGMARATTPLLPVALAGPAYFVSHAGLKFPELVIVLSGYGTTIQLHAETFISSSGVTSSTFRTVPDAPVGTFELALPEGKYSALAANTNLCKAKLKMPTAFTAQNGMVIKRSTPINVTGCTKHKDQRSSSKHKSTTRKKKT
jgi:hypothetical protein